MEFSDLINIDDVERRARSIIPAPLQAMFMSGSGEEITLKDNVKAYDRYLLMPRMLVDVSTLKLETTLFGQTFALPFGFAPSAAHQIAHPLGEIATAKSAAHNKLLMVLSTTSTATLEDVAEAGGNETPLWFQLYVFKDREVTLQLVRRAEKAGYRAIVLTVDSSVLAALGMNRRIAAPPPSSAPLKWANVEGHIPEGDPIFSLISQLDFTLSWKDVDWLRSQTSLPIVVKGILSPEDAVTAVSHGVSGIIVSNHGGIQVDSAPATIEALPGVVEAVAGRVPVMVDGGIRRGNDILKALALGAKMVFIGRPVFFGLAVGGVEGLNLVVEMLRDELKKAMVLCGCPDVANIPRSIAVHRSRFESTL